MPTWPPPLPNRQELIGGLTAVFNRDGASRGRLIELRRREPAHATSFPCEVVRARFEDGTRLNLFCKYEADDGGSSHGQRGGVSYEVEVYRRMLQPSGISTPAFFGCYTDPKSGARWLFLENVIRSVAVGKVGKLSPMRQATHWIGEFHALQEKRLAKAPLRFLTRYSAEYYRGWARRTARFSGRWHRRFPWLRPLCKRLEEDIAQLAEYPQTVIHGEYYPHNILYQRGVVRPIDWETAAVAVGEIDLATISEGWSRAWVQRFVQDYQQARWPNGPPPHFSRALDLARIYMQLRWLGDSREWTSEKSSLWRFNQLRFLSE